MQTEHSSMFNSSIATVNPKGGEVERKEYINEGRDNRGTQTGSGVERSWNAVLERCQGTDSSPVTSVTVEDSTGRQSPPQTSHSLSTDNYRCTTDTVQTRAERQTPLNNADWLLITKG